MEPALNGAGVAMWPMRCAIASKVGARERSQERARSRARAFGKLDFRRIAACGSVLAAKDLLKECALRKVSRGGARIKGGSAGATHVVARGASQL